MNKTHGDLFGRKKPVWFLNFPTNLKSENIDVEEWTIKPMRHKGKARTGQVSGFRHRDLVTYTYRNGETHTGYVTALYPDKNQLNFQSPTKHCKRVNALKTKLLLEI